MKRGLITIFICLFVVVSVLAQDAHQKPATERPAATERSAPGERPIITVTVDQILDKYVQAVGGKTAIEKVTSRMTKGTFEIPAAGLSGPIESYSKAPNSHVDIITITGFGTIQAGFNGSTAWSQDPQTGLRDITGVELASIKREAELHRELKLKQQYTSMTVTGKGKVGNSEAYIVEATPAEGAPEKFYFDTQTGLLLRQDTEQEGPQGKIPTETYYEDYKDVDGIKVPHTSRQSSPLFTIVTKVTEVKHNVTVDDAKFNKPSAK